MTRIYAWITEGHGSHKLDRLWKFQASEVGEWVRGGGAVSSAEDAWPDRPDPTQPARRGATWWTYR